jgi:hypothetical protein
MNPPNRIPILMRWLLIALILGWAWQMFRWSIPLRSLLWNQELMEGLIQNWFGITWAEYAGNPLASRVIDRIQYGLGAVFLLSGLGALFLPISWRKLRWSLGITASLILLFVFYLLFREQFYRWGNLVEHSIQMTLPILFCWVVYRQSDPKLIWLMKAVIALTFLGHGLYAIGYYPVPGKYIDMLVSIVGLKEAQCLVVLKIAGVLDVLVAVLIWFPRLTRYVLYYAIVWGSLTALARVVAYWEWAMWVSSLDQWLNQTLIRLGHGGVPLALYWMIHRD